MREESHDAEVGDPRTVAAGLGVWLAVSGAACGGRSSLESAKERTTAPEPADGCAPVEFVRALSRAGGLEVQGDGHGGLVTWGSARGLELGRAGVVVAQLDEGGEVTRPFSLDEPALGELGGVAFDEDGGLVFAARFYDEVTLGDTTYPATAAGGLLLAKRSRDGSYAWSRRLDRAGPAYRGGVALDRNGNVLLEGLFAGALAFGSSINGDSGMLVSDQGPCLETFVAKLDADGRYLWGRTFAHRSCHDSGNLHLVRPTPGGPVAFDRQGNALVAAWGRGGDDQKSPDVNDPFLLKLDPDGQLLWQLRYPGLAVDDLAVNEAGEISLSAHAAQFDLEVDGRRLPAKGTNDWLMLKLSPDGRVVRALRFGAAGHFVTARMAFDEGGYAWAAAAVSRNRDAANAVNLGGFTVPRGSASDALLITFDRAWSIRQALDFGVTPTSADGYTALYFRHGFAVDQCYRGVGLGEVSGSLDFHVGAPVTGDVAQPFLFGARLAE